MGKNAKACGDVGTRLEKASRVYQKWRKEVFQGRSVSKRTKVHACRESDGDACARLWSRGTGYDTIKPLETYN